jgi:uncharacterized protein YicC (UPF0701 family)
MEISTLLPETWKEEKVQIESAIDCLKKELAEYKKQRKSEWKTLKSKFKADLTIVENSLKGLKARHKKESNRKK